MRVGLITANYGRLSIFKIFCEGVKRLREETGENIPCITSGSIDAIPLCKEYDIEFYEYPNRPLTAKFNNSMIHMCQKAEIDCVMLTGSDDLISTQTFIDIQDLMDTHDMVGLNDLYMLSMDGATSGNLYYFQHTTVLGPGRTIRKEIIERLDHPVWPIARDNTIDSMMLDSVRGLVKKSTTIKGFLVDLKNNQSMNGVEFWSKRLPVVSKDILYGNIGAREKYLINEMISQ